MTLLAYRASTGVTTFTSWLLKQERDGVITNELALVLVNVATACKKISSLVARAPIDGEPRDAMNNTVRGIACAATPTKFSDHF